MKIVANLKMRLENVSKLVVETNEHLNKIELKEALKEEKIDTMRWDASKMKNVYTKHSWTEMWS